MYVTMVVLFGLVDCQTGSGTQSDSPTASSSTAAGSSSTVSPGEECMDEILVIDFKLVCYIHYGTPLIWLTFRHALLSVEFLLFPGLWLVEQFLRICRQTADRFELRFGGPTPYGPPMAWLTFGCTSLNFCHFLASDLWSSLHPGGAQSLAPFVCVCLGFCFADLAPSEGRRSSQTKLDATAPLVVETVLDLSNRSCFGALKKSSWFVNCCRSPTLHKKVFRIRQPYRT